MREEGCTDCTCRNQDESAIDEGIIPEEDGEHFAEDFLVEGTGGIGRSCYGDGDESLEKSPKEGLQDEEAADASEM